MRGDRLVSIVLLLQSHGRLTAADLAEKLEVSERTIYRDLEALSGTGIPVIAERGRNGGWSLLENYRTTLTGLKESEIRTLFVSPSTQLLEDLGLARTSEEARNKLIASLPSEYRAKAKEVWNRIHIDTSTWRDRKEKIVTFDILKNAIWSNCKLKIEYQAVDGKTTERVVGPLGLIAKGSRWYLIACKEDGEFRNYRASRIEYAELTDKPFERPEDFDLASYWKSSTKAFIEKLPDYSVWVEAAPSILPRMTFTGRFVKQIEAGNVTGEGWTPIKLTFDTKEEAIGYILGFADQMKVTEPEELKAEILSAAEATVRFYNVNNKVEDE